MQFIIEPTISFAITVCNEHNELNNLLSQLTSVVLKPADEIIILSDSSNVTSDVIKIITKYAGLYNNIKHISKPLNNNFEKIKNNFIKNCTKDYIFQIDADEELGVYLMLIHDILRENPEKDVFLVPRINTVSDLDPEYAKSIGWSVNYKQFYEGLPIINWPDFQYRIFKNNSKIKWKGEVHEKIVGQESYTLIHDGNIENIDSNRKFSLIHKKTFDRQKKQNEYYETFNK